MTETKDRHGCLTAWLVLMIVANTLTALIYVVFRVFNTYHSTRLDTPVWALSALTLGCIANVIFAVALFRWKRWGFFGFLITTIVTLGINLRIGVKPATTLFGLCGIIILFIVLQIGGERKGWDQLE